MGPIETRSFNTLVEQYLGERLPDNLADAIAFPSLPTDARGVVLRMLALMKRSACPVTEFNPHMIRLLSTVTPGMLPSAWGGRIPPVTFPGRHRKLDAYVARQPRPSRVEPPVFIDLGCGFPPVTTVDTAAHMPQWFVWGVDRSFAPYVLYDAEGRYACFSRDGNFEYFQPQMKPLHDNPVAARLRFTSLFEDLAPQLQIDDDQSSATVADNGNRLVYNHIRDFETKNLKFIEADIAELHLPPAGAVRCMNVLLYFERTVREKMLSAIGALLDDDGFLVTGLNHPFGIYARYTVYEKGLAGIRPREFAFSLDNLRPLGIGPWLTIKDEDREAELLADLTGAIRSDRIFWTEFNQSVDALRAELAICRRGKDGYNHFTQEAQTAPPPVLMQKTSALWRQIAAAGYTDGAVAALKRAGFHAWQNQVGDIAVRPPAGSLCERDEL